MPSSIHDIPGPMTATYQLRAHAAATATEDAFVFTAPFACKIRKVEAIWDAAITGTATNYTSVAVVNAGIDGTGTTVLGTQVDYAGGTNATAGATVPLYAPTTYPTLAAGAKLKLQLIKTGTGLALPTGLVVVTYEGA